MSSPGWDPPAVSTLLHLLDCVASVQKHTRLGGREFYRYSHGNPESNAVVLLPEVRFNGALCHPTQHMLTDSFVAAWVFHDDCYHVARSSACSSRARRRWSSSNVWCAARPCSISPRAALIRTLGLRSLRQFRNTSTASLSPHCKLLTPASSAWRRACLNSASKRGSSRHRCNVRGATPALFAASSMVFDVTRAAIPFSCRGVKCSRTVSA